MLVSSHSLFHYGHCLLLTLLLDRDRKKNEALAAKIFNRDRRASSGPTTTARLGGSLASRAGVKKVSYYGSPVPSIFFLGCQHKTNGINPRSAACPPVLAAR